MELDKLVKMLGTEDQLDADLQDYLNSLVEAEV